MLIHTASLGSDIACGSLASEYTWRNREVSNDTSSPVMLFEGVLAFKQSISSRVGQKVPL